MKRILGVMTCVVVGFVFVGVISCARDARRRGIEDGRLELKPVAGDAAVSAAFGDGFIRRTMTVNDFGGCAIGLGARRLYCWDNKTEAFPLDELPSNEGGIRMVAGPNSSRERVCVVGNAGHVFCNVGVHPNDTSLTLVKGLENVVDMFVEQTRACVVAAPQGKVLCFTTDDSTTPPKHSEPMEVAGLAGNIVEVWSSHRETNLALDGDGRVWRWGFVGGSTFTRDTVTGKKRDFLEQPEILAGVSNIAHLATGDSDPCMVDRDGHVFCMALFAGSTNDAPKPVPTRAPGLDDVIVISTTGASSGKKGGCAIVKGGRIKCEKKSGEPEPPLTDVIDLATFESAACARLANQSVHCWGGYETRDPKARMFVPRPTRVVGAAPSRFVRGTCSITKDRGAELECWGRSSLLFDVNAKLPAHDGMEWIGEAQRLPLANVASLAVGFSFTCALTQAGAIHCAGSAPAIDDASSDVWFRAPVLKAAVGKRLHLSTLGLCWEDARAPATIRCSATAPNFLHPSCQTKPTKEGFPVKLEGLGAGAAAAMLSAKSSGMCTVDPGTTTLRCWGAEHFLKAIGITTPAPPPSSAKPQCDRPLLASTLPVKLGAPGRTIKKVALGFQSVCIIDDKGTVYCAGANDHGQLGRGTKSKREDFGTLTTLEGTEPMADVDIGDHFACSLGAQTGTVYCWGKNTYGQLGDGTAGATQIQRDKTGDSFDRAAAKKIAGPANMKGISVDYDHACAWNEAGDIWCWGENESGETGTGGKNHRYTKHPFEIEAILTGKTWLDQPR